MGGIIIFILLAVAVGIAAGGYVSVPKGENQVWVLTMQRVALEWLN